MRGCHRTSLWVCHARPRGWRGLVIHMSKIRRHGLDLDSSTTRIKKVFLYGETTARQRVNAIPAFSRCWKKVSISSSIGIVRRAFSSPGVEYFQHLVPIVVDHLYGDSPALGLWEGAAGGAVEGG